MDYRHGLAGGRALLVSRTGREAAERVVRGATHVSLAVHEQLRKEFLRVISIPYDDPSDAK